MTNLIGNAKLTEAEFRTLPPNDVAAAQLARALWAVVEWIGWMEINAPDEGFAYGGPSSCEYGCLSGSADILERELKAAGIEKPLEVKRE